MEDTSGLRIINIVRLVCLSWGSCALAGGGKWEFHRRIGVLVVHVVCEGGEAVSIAARSVLTVERGICIGKHAGVVCVGIRLYAPENLLPPASPGREEALGAPTTPCKAKCDEPDPDPETGGRAGGLRYGRPVLRLDL